MILLKKTKWKRVYCSINKIRYHVHSIIFTSIIVSLQSEINIINYTILENHVHVVASFPSHKSFRSVVKSIKETSAQKQVKKCPPIKKVMESFITLPWANFIVGTLGEISKGVVLNNVYSPLKTYDSEHKRRNHLLVKTRSR
ncbi:transposase [Carnobacterium iners]|uniref:transposase n=1 Tax=Carnobacterium iners TaxID=1073423 RepID=UPI000A1C7A9A